MTARQKKAAAKAPSGKIAASKAVTAKRTGKPKGGKSPLQMLQLAVTTQAVEQAFPALSWNVRFIRMPASENYRVSWEHDGTKLHVTGSWSEIMFWIGCALAARSLQTRYSEAVCQQAAEAWRRVKAGAA